MNKKLLLLAVFTLFIGNVCAKKKYYTCNYRIEELDTISYTFRDSIMTFALSISETLVGVGVQNRTKKPMFIDWEQSALVINGTSERCIHKGIKYIEKDNAQPKSVIAPGSSFADIMIPSSYIYFNSEDYKTYYKNPHWETKKIISLESSNKEEEAFVLSQEGMKIGVMLAIEINRTLEYKYYTLLCYNIKEK